MKTRIKILSLALLSALSLMALSAATAYAVEGETEGKLTVGGTEIPVGEEVPVEGTAGAGKLLVPGLGLTVECSSAVATGKLTNIETTNLRHAHGSIHILYSGCKVAGSAVCKVYETAEDRDKKVNAEHILATALLLYLGKIKLANGTVHLVFTASPLAGSKLFTKLFLTKSTGGCTLPSENEITGTTAFNLNTGMTEAKEHSLEPASEEEEKTLGVAGLKYGAEPARLDEGVAKAVLTGAKFAGKEWSLK
jgi:hypothetical protein